jgi:sugar-phosphatase
MIRAAIFDMDGLLVDSEPLWRQAEQDVFGALGLRLTEDDCMRTTGLRVDEVVRHWFALHPWPGPGIAEVGATIVERVVALIRDQGEAKPGAAAAVAAARRAGLRTALATGSSFDLIDATLERLGLVGAFEVRCSAQSEPYGKPHPAVFLTTAARLGVDPTECVVLEDSLPGVIAAKAARMRCIAVPETTGPGRARFAVADVVLDSLELVTADLFASLS